MIEFVYTNPVIEAVQRTGTEVLVRHADCKDKNAAGWYELNPPKKIDQLVICPNNHKNYSDLADTIRHEAWHVVQACYGGALTKRHQSMSILEPSTIKHIKSTYPDSHLDKEYEAWAIAEHASETYIVRALNARCYQ